jgi:predicted RNA-binding protein with PIN domain
MLYLIDGYNLLHALGVLPRRAGPRGLEKARLRLLGLLRASHGDDASAVTVVFDAAHAPPGVSPERDYQGIHIVFAVGQAAADDLIEQLIRRAPAPKQLAVVSDDHRIQQAARRRHCHVLGCMDYLDELDRRRQRPAPSAEGPAKPEGVSRDETQHWLREFADLQNDPDWKKLVEPPEFFEAEG